MAWIGISWMIDPGWVWSAVWGARSSDRLGALSGKDSGTFTVCMCYEEKPRRELEVRVEEGWCLMASFVASMRLITLWDAVLISLPPSDSNSGPSAECCRCCGPGPRTCLNGCIYVHCTLHTYNNSRCFRHYLPPMARFPERSGFPPVECHVWVHVGCV